MDADSTRVVSYAALEAATDGFDVSRVVGRGGFGAVSGGPRANRRAGSVRGESVEASVAATPRIVPGDESRPRPRRG